MWVCVCMWFLIIFAFFLMHCCCSVAQLCPTLCDPMDLSTPGFPVLHHLPEFAQTHVHWISDAIQPSYPLSPPSPLALWVWGLVLNLTQGTPKVVNQPNTSENKVGALGYIYLFIFLWGLTTLTHPQGQGLPLRSPVWCYVTLLPQPWSLELRWILNSIWAESVQQKFELVNNRFLPLFGSSYKTLKSFQFSLTNNNEMFSAI